MTDDLVKRLRLWGEHGLTNTLSDLVEAADHIEALTAEVERLTEAYNSLGNKAVEQVAKMGTEIGRKDCEIDVLTADLTQSKREVERLREALGDIESIPDHSRHDDWEVSRKMQLIARAALAGKAEQ